MGVRLELEASIGEQALCKLGRGLDLAKDRKTALKLGPCRRVVTINPKSLSKHPVGGAIAFGAQSFEGNGFRGERRIIDISGDGPNNMGAYVILARDRAVADDITINGLPIINDRPNINGYPLMPNLDLYYEDCVIGGFGAFIVVADGFKDFARAILRKLVTEIAGRAPPRHLLRLAAARPRPLCNAGEVQYRKWLEKWLKNYRPPTPLYDF